MNPYRVAEKIGNAFIIALFAVAIGVALWAVVWTLLEDGWGWNVLWLIPGIPVALAVLVLVSALFQVAGWYVEEKWREGKRTWENNRREDS